MSEQEEAWRGDCGMEYHERNDMTAQELDNHYQKLYGFELSDMHQFWFNSDPAIGDKWLEVGCGTGNIMNILHLHAAVKLYGVDINEAAVVIAKRRGFNVQIASALKLPFEDESFDMVYTSGLLIHIQPDDLKQVMGEIVRVSKRYVWGLEYYHPTVLSAFDDVTMFRGRNIDYRGKKGLLWASDYVNWYRTWFRMKRLREVRLVRLDGKGEDSMFLLEKQT